MIDRQVSRIRGVYGEFPSHFWTLMGATFIDSVGGALLFPFFTLYVTAKFGIGMTEVGLLFAVYSVASIGGSAIGGGLADKLGRKRMVMFGLAASALSSLGMGFANGMTAFLGAALLAGFFGNMGGPARQAMVADLLPEKDRTQGYGILRVVINLAVAIGPAIGGLLASYSFLWLFIADSVSSVIMAVIVAGRLPETKPEPKVGDVKESTLETFQGYGKIFRDVPYMLFLMASSLMVLVYMQMNGSLAVFLRDIHSVNEQGFGMIISLNAGMVVLFQFSISRLIKRYKPMYIMALGSAIYAVGFAMYGFVSAYVFFLLAMAIITIGEMLVAPTGQALAATLAPEDMRGRYLAIYGLTWGIPYAFGLILAGLIMDNTDPRWLWYAAGMVGLMAAAVFTSLQGRVSLRIRDLEAEATGEPGEADRKPLTEVGEGIVHAS